MRITGGSSRGIRLKVPPGRIVRPTRDAVRQALFNILGDWPAGKRVLDLYAGSGSLGLEALSRGAMTSVFVENDRRSASCLEANIEAAGMKRRGQFVFTDVLEYLDGCAQGGREAGFDGVFADPPFAFSNSEGLNVLVEKLSADRLWTTGDLVCVVEIEASSKLSSALEKLPGEVALRSYGRNLLAIARRRRDR